MLTLLVALLRISAQAQTPDAARALAAAQQKATVEGDLKAAIAQYNAIATKYAKTDRAAVATALIRMAEAYEKLGDAQARAVWERVLREFGDQKDAVAIARAKLESGVARETTVKIWSGDPLFIGQFWHPSPDGRYLVGRPQRDMTTNPGLFLHDIPSNTNRRLTRGAAFHAHFTPDSRRVVFEWTPPEASLRSEGVREIRTVNVDGTGERTIFRGSPYRELEVSAVSADGRTAAVGFHRTDGTWQVGLVSLTTGEVSILKNNEWRDTYAGNFSPDGRWLVYWAQGEKGILDDPREAPQGGIYALATDGSAEHPLVPARVAGRAPHFTPDGSRVVFTSHTPGRNDLWSVRVADGKPVGAQEMVSARGGLQSFMGFSRDGSLYFTETSVHVTVSVADVDPVTRKAQGALRDVSSAYRDGTVSAPAWSPDGKVLAYQWAASDVSDIKIVLQRFDGAPERELWFPRQVALRGWSGDGRLLIAYGTEMKLRDVDTGREEPFLDTKQGALAEINAIGQATRAEMYAKGILFVETEGPGGTRGELLGAAVHPDGRQIAIARRVITRSVGVTRNLFSQRASAR
jgi:Tol biopolymer transport system component